MIIGLIRQRLMGIGLLVGIVGVGFWQPPAQAISSQCRWIRQIRQIAIESGFPSGRLADLEYDYCRRPRRTRRSRPDTTSNCFHLTMMLSLAQTTGNIDTNAIASEKTVACAFPDSRPQFPWKYPNGQTVKLGSNWYYPNGQLAKFGSRWNYPNGQIASQGSSFWRYPNGNQALRGDRGNLPSGRATSRTDLLRWACGQVGSRYCANTLMDITEQAEILQEATIVKLAWRAEQFAR